MLLKKVHDPFVIKRKQTDEGFFIKLSYSISISYG